MKIFKYFSTMEIQEIKTRLSIAQVLEHYNLKADGTALGKNARLCCPFHDDKTPSMQVYEKTNTVYCFSANCKTHGHSLDVIDFIMHQENISKHEALKKATQMVTGGVPHPTDEMTKTELLTKLFNYFKNGLKSSPQAREYCQSRGLYSLGIGFRIKDVKI
jgi:DNA primase